MYIWDPKALFITKAWATKKASIRSSSLCFQPTIERDILKLDIALKRRWQDLEFKRLKKKGIGDSPIFPAVLPCTFIWSCSHVLWEQSTINF